MKRMLPGEERLARREVLRIEYLDDAGPPRIDDDSDHRGARSPARLQEPDAIRLIRSSRQDDEPESRLANRDAGKGDRSVNCDRRRVRARLGANGGCEGTQVTHREPAGHQWL